MLEDDAAVTQHGMSVALLPLPQRAAMVASDPEMKTRAHLLQLFKRLELEFPLMSDPIEITIRALSSESEKVGRVVSLVSQTKRASGLAAVSASNPKGGITKPESGRGTDNGAWKHDKFEEKAAAIASGKRVVVQRPAGDLRNSLISDRVEAIIDEHNSGRAPTAADTVERWGHDKYVGKDLRDQIGGAGGIDHRGAKGARVVVRPDGTKITRKGRGNFTASSSMDD